MLQDGIPEGLTFDDVLLQPARSAVLPAEVDTRTCLTRKIALNIPIVSAAMDTVTESHLAIALAQQGGIGIIHRNMSIERQAEEVDRVKRSESGMIVDPITVGPRQLISEALELMKRFRISGVPVTEERQAGRHSDQPRPALRDALRPADLRGDDQGEPHHGVRSAPRSRRPRRSCTAPRREAAGGGRRLQPQGPDHGQGHPEEAEVPERRQGRAGPAAGGRGDRRHGRTSWSARRNWCARKVDVLAIDTAHGHTTRVMDAVRAIKRKLPEVQLITGNVATYEGARELIVARRGRHQGRHRAGLDLHHARGVGRRACRRSPRFRECARATREAGVPLIADGGIKFSGDITKAIAAGADSVMIGSLLAGTDESPGETILYQGRTFKTYRGMGSMGAMAQGSADRYAQDAQRASWCPEGIEGRVASKGPLSELVYQLVGGLRAGMGYCGARNIRELQENARFLRVSPAGLRESHVHDVIITKEAPNYRLE